MSIDARVLTPLERVLITDSRGRCLTGHFLSYNYFGDPLVAYHDHPTGNGWARRDRHEVTGSGQRCECASARRARRQT
jgi:hypothetical protein